MNEITNFISTLGFPIAVACALGYALYKILRIIVDKLIVVFDAITHTNEELVRTNSILASKIENKIDIVINKLDGRE